MKDSPGNACAAMYHTNAGTGFWFLPKRKTHRSRAKTNAVGGCDFAARPSLTSIAQSVFWSPVAISSVLTLMPAPEHLSSVMHPGLPIFDSAQDGPEGKYVIFDGKTRSEILLFPNGNYSPSLVALIPIDAELLSRTEALTRFWRVLNGRKPPPDTRVTQQQRRRLRLMIRATDGRMHGASYREIACAIYGEARVASDPWKTSPLRDSVIDLVGGGTAMVAGGYLNLLRHRRRS